MILDNNYKIGIMKKSNVKTRRRESATTKRRHSRYDDGTNDGKSMCLPELLCDSLQYYINGYLASPSGFLLRFILNL